jgi:hypothetical protein
VNPVNKTILMVLATTLTAASALAGSSGPGYVPEGFDELTRQKGVFKKTLIRPGADFSSYTKLYPRKVMLQFREQRPPEAPAATGSLVRKRSKVAEPPSYEDLATFRQIINDAIVSELEQSGTFQLVHEEGPETLVLRASFTDVVSDFSSNSSRSDGKRVPVSAQGTIVFDLIDGETGVIQARLSERRKCTKGDGSGETAGEDPRWAKVGGWAVRAAADLRLELERVTGPG